MTQYHISRISSFRADISVPGDKSISHRSAIFGGLSNGVCEVKNFLPSEDCLNTLHAMQALGVKHEVLGELKGYGPNHLRIHGTSMSLSAPTKPIDCGNAGTGMRLLAGLLAGQTFTSELFGDASLSSRPMGRIIKPLTQMGAKIDALGAKESCAPLRITGGNLNPITYDMPMASAQVKSAILIAGLFAKGKTTVNQPAISRDHTERMLEAFQVKTEVNGLSLSIEGGQMPQASDFTVPGDVSSAAFWLVAASAMPGAHLIIRNVGLNPTRDAVIHALKRMGAQIEIKMHAYTGEPIGDIEIHGSQLKGTTLLRDEIPNLIDEIPVISIAAALAEGQTVIRDAKELRVKETDRITTVVNNLRAMGGVVDEFEDGMVIHGGHALHGATLNSYGDHRIAMSFAIAGLFASGETIIENTECVNTSYPGFYSQLQQIASQH